MKDLCKSGNTNNLIIIANVLNRIGGFNMNELISIIEKGIQSLKSDIQRNRNYTDLPFTNSCDHLYRGLLLQIRLESWEQFLKLTNRFKSSRNEPFIKQSDFFEDIMKSQIKGIPGFVTKKTLKDMSEYMKQLEWRIEELNGIWKTDVINEIDCSLVTSNIYH